MDFSAIVLAGGTSQRLGGRDKAMAPMAGATLLERVLDAVADASAITVVGPQRPIARAVTWCQEQPIGGGPVAAFAAGLAVSPRTDTILLLATDLPFIAEAVPLLLKQAITADVAVLRDSSGRTNYLASAWQRAAVEERLAQVGDPTGLPMRRLFEQLTIAEVADIGDWGFDCDTPEALEIAQRRGDEFTR